jgi:ABC-type nitrate/sulfonate/bicarbonate transport system substrate-binding protein
MRVLRSLLLAFAGIAATAQVHSQEVRVGYWASGASAAIGLVLEEGKFLEAEGLKPAWTTMTKLAEVNRALISKSIDIAVAGGTLPSLRLGAENVPAKIILANLVADANFVVPEQSPIKTMADLKGKKIGSTSPGSTIHALVGAILQGNYGLGASDFQQIPSGEAQLLTFLQRGEIDAALMRTITLQTFGQQAKLRSIGTVPEEWKKLIKANSPPVLGVGVVDVGFAEKNPEVVVKYLVASIKATQWGSKNPDKVAEILKHRLQMSDADAKVFAATWTDSYVASFDEADLTSLLKMAEIFKTSDNFPGTVTRDVFFPEFFKKAKAIAGVSR